MRKYLLITVFFTLIGMAGYSQTYFDNCTDANNSPSYSFMDGIEFSGTTSGENDGIYTSTNITVNTTTYLRLNIPTSGNYTFTFTDGANPISGDISLAFGNTCDFSSTNEEYSDTYSSGIAAECAYLEVGDQILLLATEDAGTFDFNLTITLQTGSPANDECVNAEPITLGSDCEWLDMVSANSAMACPEGFSTTSCDFTQGAYVWYEFTTPAGTDFIDIRNLGATVGTPRLMIVEQTADCDNVTPVSDCIESADATGLGIANLISVTENTSYMMVVGTDDPAGALTTFDIKAVIPPDNDMCASPDVVNSSMSGDVTMGSTDCATGDMDIIAGCESASDVTGVFYTYTVPAGIKTLTVTLGRTSGTGDMTLIALTSDCDGTYYGDAADSESCGSAPELVIDCPTEGDIIIFEVATDWTTQGDFDLTLTNTLMVDPSITNDACTDPETLTLSPDCEWLDMVNANSVTACPESFNVGCDFTQGAYVWYEFTTPAGTEFIDIRNLSATVGTPRVMIVEQTTDCDNVTPVSDCIESADAAGLGIADLIAVSENTTYMMVVGTDDPAGALTTFDIKAVIPPDNDMCASPDVVTSSMGGDVTMGSTDCATGDMDIIAGCESASDVTGVFYTYTVPAGIKTLTVTLGRTSGTGDMTLIALTSDCDGTYYGEAADSESCGSAPELVIDCPTEGDIIIFEVATDWTTQGDFDLTLTNTLMVDPSITNDGCTMPEALTLSPDCEWLDMVNANSVTACPESFNVGCDFTQGAYVWYEFTTPAGTEFIDIRNLSATVGTPRVLIVEQTTDCEDVTPVSNCIESADADGLGAGNLITVTENTTYMMVVGTDDPAGAVTTFDIKAVIPPDNDECADAIPLMEGSSESGTTVCAGGPITGSDCDTDKENTVWYSYEVMPDDKELTIDVTSYMATSGGADQFSVAVYEACDTDPLVILLESDGTSADYCGSVDPEEELTLSCLEAGTTIFVMVSSSSANEGTFDLTLNSTALTCTYTNDDCDSPEVLGEIDTDDPDDCTIVAGCNDLACMQYDYSSICGSNVYNSVWFEFTTDADADDAYVDIEISNGESGEMDSPIVMLADDACQPSIIQGCHDGTGGSVDSGPLGGPGVITANTTYRIIVFNGDGDQNGGTFDLCVTVNSGCVNDVPCDAQQLEPEVTYDGGSSVGCTMDETVMDCGGNGEDMNSSWYKITVPDGMGSMEITVNNAVMDGATGDGSIAVYNPGGDCNAVSGSEPIYEDCQAFSNLHKVQCVQPGQEYFILVATNVDPDDGTFEITVNFEADVFPPNDLCANRQIITPETMCEIQRIEGTLQEACPWVADSPDGACTYSQNPTVFYEFTVPTGTPQIVGLDLEITGLNDPMVSLGFDLDCTGDSGSYLTINSLNSESGALCLTDGMFEGQPLMAGQTYYLVVSSSSGEMSAFELRLRFITPPENDDPCETWLNPPYDLGTAGSHSGTTCCARGPEDQNADGSDADFGHDMCGGTSEESAVWYKFTPDEGDDGYDITVNGLNGATEIYWAQPEAGCGGGFGMAVNTDCDDGNGTMKLPNCPPNAGDIVYIKVSSSKENCSDFTIEVSPAMCDGQATDDCEDADVMASPTTPEDCYAENPGIDVTGCLTYACPETSISDCGQDMGPTVWIQVEIDEDAAQLVTKINGAADLPWDPVWSIYKGDCSSLELVASQFDGMAVNCSNGAGTNPAVHPVGVDFDDSETYYIAVTAGNPIPNEDMEFTMNISTTEGCVACVGDAECSGTVAEFEVVNRTNADGTPSERALDDPFFCPGEMVRVCIDFPYDATETGNDWMHGIIPNFGNGWDYDASGLNSMSGPNNTTNTEYGGDPVWFEQDPSCVAATEDFPFIKTYVDENGRLQICNEKCGTCPDDAEDIEDGDPLPAGWFWNNSGSPCSNDPNCPNTNYGIGNRVSPINLCFDLVVRSEFTNSCEDQSSLNISFQTTSDGISGCYDDPQAECLLDAMQIGPDWRIECVDLPKVLAEDVEICNGGTIDIPIQLDDGSGLDIEVFVVDNPDVSGDGSVISTDENSPTIFGGGSGNIIETLTNDSNTEQTVIYVMRAINPDVLCPAPYDTVEVIIYTDIEIEFNPDPVNVCRGDMVDVTAITSGGTNGTYTYSWYDDGGSYLHDGDVHTFEATEFATSGTFRVEVVDDLGCEGEAEIFIEIQELPDFEISGQDQICKDGTVDNFFYELITDQFINFFSASIDWSVENLDQFAAGDVEYTYDGTVLTINEENSDDGNYRITATLIDEYGCEGMATFDITITSSYMVEVDPINLPCGETIFSITARTSDGSTPDHWILYDCDDNQIREHWEPAFSADGEHEFINLDLNDLSDPFCFYVVAEPSDNPTCGGQSVEITVSGPSDGTPMTITNPEICIGDDGVINVTNASAFSSFVITNLTSMTTYTSVPATIPTSDLSTTTSFKVEGTDVSGCLSRDTVDIVVNPQPTFSVTGPRSFCTGSSTTLSVPGDLGYTYDWTGGGTVSMDTAYTVGSPETVTVVATSGSGCKDTISVVITEDTTIDLGDDMRTICDNSDEILSVDATYTDIRWYTVDGATETELTAEAGNAMITINMPGIYKVTFTDPAAGCSGEGLFTIAQNLTPNVQVTADTVRLCNRNIGSNPTVLDFMGQIVSGGSGGTWTEIPPGAPGLILTDLNNVDYTGITAGVYLYEYRVDGEVPCGPDMDTLIVKVTACSCPEVMFNPVTICVGETYDLNDSRQPGYSEGTWQFVNSADGDASVLSGSIFNSSMSTTISGGSYIFDYVYTPTPSSPCETSERYTLNVQPLQEIELTDIVICNSTGKPQPSMVDLDTLVVIPSAGGGSWTDIDGTPLSSTVIDGATASGTSLQFIYTLAGDAICPAVSDTLTVVISECNCPRVEVDDATLCNDMESSVLLSDYLINDAAPAIGGTWKWNGVLGAITGDMINVNGVPEGTYDVIFTLDSDPNPGNDCVLADTAQWTIYAKPSIVLGTGTDPCNVDDDPDDTDDPRVIDLDDWLDVTTDKTGTWTFISGPDTKTIDVDNKVSFAGNAEGDMYVFRYTLDAQSPCTDATADVTITVRNCDCAKLTLNSAPNVCNDSGMFDVYDLWSVEDTRPGDMIEVTVKNAAGDDLGDRITDNEFDATGLPAGDYTLEVKLISDDESCNDTKTSIFRIENYAVTELARDTVQVKNDNSGNNFVNFNDFLLDSGLGGIWTDLDGSGVSFSNLESVSFFGVPTGFYRYTYVIDNAEPCNDVMLTAVVEVVDCTPSNPSNPDPVCIVDGTVDLSQYSDSDVPGTWSTSEAGLSINGSILDYSGVTAGQYDLIYTASSTIGNSCGPVVRRISVVEPMSAGTPNELSPSEHCLGSTVTISLEGMLDDQDQGGVWTNISAISGGEFDAVNGSFNLTDAGVGIYTFKYSFDNADPCNDSEATVEIIIYGNPNADAGPDQMLDCDTPEVEIGGNSTPADVLGYKWKEILNGIILNPSDMPTIVADQAGTYELTVTDLSNAALCTDQDSTIVAIEDGVPTIELFVEQPQCFGDMGSITGSNPSGGSGNYTYSFNGGPFNNELSFNNLTPGQEYSFVIRNEDNGCEKEYTEVVDNVFEFEVALIDTIIVGNVNANFDLTFEVTTPSDVQTVKWTDDEGNVLCEGDLATCDTLSVTPTRNTIYFVELTNTNGCVTNDQLEIRLEEIVDVDFPNIIRPGSKNGNGSFYIQSDNVKNIRQLIIFDRWGEKVFDVQNIPPNDPNQGWDGTFRGKEVVPGVYTWLVELELQTSAGTPAGEMKETGDVTVIR